ncbi:MAG: hypothetical protein ABR875_03145 [Minisyncoccia bacterium]
MASHRVPISVGGNRESSTQRVGTGKNKTAELPFERQTSYIKVLF